MVLLVGRVTRAAIPAEPAKEQSHPASVALAKRRARVRGAKDEAEKVDWRDKPENNIVFPVTFNIHNPTITPYLPAKEKATGAAVTIPHGRGAHVPHHGPRGI